MPISFANVALTPLHEHQQLVARYWHEHRIQEFEFQAYFVPNIQQLPTPYIPQREPPAIGRLTCPTGADKFSVCHLVATGEQVNAVNAVLGNSPTSQTLLITDGTAAGTISTPMFRLPPRPIAQRGTNEWYLLTLVDSRYYWYMSGGAEIPASPATWSDFLEDLFALVGVTASIDPIPAAYLTPNTLRWATGIQPIPIVIEALCRQVGLRVVRNLNGSISVVNYSTAFNEDTLRWDRVRTLAEAGGRVEPTDIGRYVPSSVDVCFFDGNTGTFEITNKTLASLGIAQYGATTGVSEGVGRITADPLQTTAGQRTAYATQAATDYYNWALSLTDATLRGIVNESPVGLDGMVEWVHHPDMLVTRIIRPVWSDSNIYGDLGANYPNPNWLPGGGSGSGSSGSGGSGSGDQPGCSASIPAASFECRDGERIATVPVLAVGVGQDGTLQLVECDSEQYDLGPCSPKFPKGVQVPLVDRVCPIVGFWTVVSSGVYQITYEDDLIALQGGDCTLPDAGSGSQPGGDVFTIKNFGSGSATVDGGSGQIDGNNTITLAQYESITVVVAPDEINWAIISKVT